MQTSTWRACRKQCKRMIFTAGYLLSLAGCVAVPSDRGLPQTQSLLSARSEQTFARPESTHERDCTSSGLSESDSSRTGLQKPTEAKFTADTAVRIAFRCSVRMRELYAELALSQADVYEATRLPNPTLDFSLLKAAAPDDIVKTTWSISQSFIDLLMLPLRQRQGRAALLVSQQRAAASALELERDVRMAYANYIAAKSHAQLQRSAAEAANLSARAAERYRAAGNISELQESREKAEALEVALEAGKTDAALVRRQSELLSLLGITSAAAGELLRAAPETLPLPAKLRVETAALLAVAREQRLDIQAQKLQVEMAERHAREVRLTRWVDEANVGFEREAETDAATLSGPRAGLTVPLFNSGKHKALRARAMLETSRAALAQGSVVLENDLLAAHGDVQASDEAVRLLRERLVPLKARMTELSQREFNYMFIGTFELLMAKREELAAYQKYIEAVREGWLAQIELQRVLGGKLSPQWFVVESSETAP